jgi:predicted ArsR family transcriptional regulator
MGEELPREHVEFGQEGDPDVIRSILAERGYEPQAGTDGGPWLRDCVFDGLAERQRDLVCGMNLALLRGVLRALPDADLEARLDPAPGRCCVVLGRPGGRPGELN